jgi:hypothetical protein
MNQANPVNPFNNPDPAAIRRVIAPIPKPHSCPYCQSRVELLGNKAVYGRAYGDWPYVYVCANLKCRAYVGLHPRTDIPLGTLANAELRQARKTLKGIFNRIWQDKHKNRTDAYWWLARKMGIKNHVQDCHIALFNVEQCQEAQRHCTEFLTAPKGKSYVNTTGKELPHESHSD